eukprot:RCo048728
MSEGQLETLRPFPLQLHVLAAPPTGYPVEGPSFSAAPVPSPPCAVLGTASVCLEAAEQPSPLRSAGPVPGCFVLSRKYSLPMCGDHGESVGTLTFDVKLQGLASRFPSRGPVTEKARGSGPTAAALPDAPSPYYEATAAVTPETGNPSYLSRGGYQPRDRPRPAPMSYRDLAGLPTPSSAPLPSATSRRTSATQTVEEQQVRTPEARCSHCHRHKPGHSHSHSHKDRAPRTHSEAQRHAEGLPTRGVPPALGGSMEG